MAITGLISDTVFTRSIERRDDLLIHDRAMVVHLPGLLTDEYCASVAAKLRGLALDPYAATVGSTEYAPIPKLGPALFEFHDEMHSAELHGGDGARNDSTDGLTRYFDQAHADSERLRGLFLDGTVPDPLDVLHTIAGELLGGPVEVAREGDRSYFSGVVRDINGGALPHYDDASVDTPNLLVGQTDRQLSILMYLTDFVGGGITSYEAKPSAFDNAERQLGYGYDWEAVQGLTYQGVTPTRGSVVAFNPRYLHSVAPIPEDQRRLTVSAFVGRTVGGDLVSWS